MHETTDKDTGSSAICCAVFRAEIIALKERHWPGLTLRFLNSMLHMRPDKLADLLDTQLNKNALQKRKTLLIYGDCCMRMEDLTEKFGSVRVRGNNCCHILLGTDSYRRFSHDGAFFLFPEWTLRWKHIFQTELGLNETNAKSLMGDMHRKLVYLDTGVLPIPTRDLDDLSRYCGLPWEVMQVSLEHLRETIQDALDKLNS
jgi:hypothetical protein